MDCSCEVLARRVQSRIANQIRTFPLPRTVGRAAFSASHFRILDGLELLSACGRNMSGQGIGSLTAAEPTTNTQMLAPSMAAPHKDVAGQMPWQKYLRPGSGSKSSVRHQYVNLMQNYAIVINR